MSASKANWSAPKGTRDFYPEDQLRKRYIVESWRATSIRHAFEEIDGPTFETSDLYAVKSGEGILGELFQAYSGKSPEEVEQVMTDGRAPYALRPEFTPTLARMYAARAKQLPGVTRWFCVPTFFRAERPQRGRLREFMQWNCDVLGESQTEYDYVNTTTEVCAVALNLLHELSGQTPGFSISDRRIVDRILVECGAKPEKLSEAKQFLDSYYKLKDKEKDEAEKAAGIDMLRFTELEGEIWSYSQAIQEQIKENAFSLQRLLRSESFSPDHRQLLGICGILNRDCGEDAAIIDLKVVRGLAYYTGAVFEMLTEGERAVAGGGRYDNLIELFGGQPTPAVGFGMGDVVLTNLLDDRNLMPEGAELRDAIDRIVRSVSLRPQAFVVANGDEDNEPLVTPLLAQLRRGIEREGFQDEVLGPNANPWDADRYTVPPIHARTTDKSTRNPKKLLNDANRVHARFFVEIHADTKVEVRDLDANESLTPANIGVNDHASFTIDPTSPAYVGQIFQPSE